MKPCPRNKKLIAWLAVDALEPERTRSLRDHLNTCAGCRQYWREIIALSQDTGDAAIPSPILQASHSFYTGLDQKILSDVKRSISTPAMDWFRRWFLGWRMAGAMAMVSLVGIVFWHGSSRPRAVFQSQPSFISVPSPNQEADDLRPTLCRYCRAANISFDALNELLAKQAALYGSFTPINLEATP